MPKQCIINVTIIKSVDKTSLREKIGSLSKKKMLEINAGLNLVLRFEL